MAKHFSKILHATDYSKASARALDEAVALAKQNRAELLVLHVIEPVTPYVAGEDMGGAELYMKLEVTTRQEAEASMNEICQEPKSKLDSHWNARPDWPFQAPHGKRCQPSHFNSALSGAHCPRKVICEYG